MHNYEQYTSLPLSLEHCVLTNGYFAVINIQMALCYRYCYVMNSNFRCIFLKNNILNYYALK